MAQRTPAAGFEPGIESLLAQLDDVCALLRDASGEPFRLIEGEEDSSGAVTHLAPGWVLAGSDDSRRREAAAELLSHVLGAEREIESLCTEILERYEEVTLVQRLGLRMAQAVDEESLAQVVVSELTDWLHSHSGELWLRDGDTTRLAAVEPPECAPGGPLGEFGPLEALEDGREWKQEPGRGAQAIAAIPIPSGDKRVLGVLVLRGKEGNRPFEQREIQVLGAVAALVSGFLQSHRLARRSWLREHEGRATHLSRLIRPRGDQVYPGLELATACLEGQQPGSDYHDLVKTADGGLALCLARVSTGGPLAVVQMAMAKGVLQAEARAGSSPGRMLRRLNEVVSPELIRSELFATAYVARFHPGGRRVDVASAGYAAPLLARSGAGVEEIDLAGPALGLLRATEHDEGNRELQAGDVLVFYSDGVLEAKDREGNGLDPDYLRELVSTAQGATAAEIRERLVGALESHCAGRVHEYDASLIVVKVS